MKTSLFLTLTLLLPLAAPAAAQQATVRLTIKDHQFQPSQPRAPANQPFTIVVKNF